MSVAGRLVDVSACWWLALALWLTPLRVSAQGVAQSASQSLFDQGRELMLEQRYEPACGKFEESYAIEAATGTLLNLALCHERTGKLASAYVEYSDALARSLRARDAERERIARQQLELLRPRLPKIVISPTDEYAGQSFWVTLDGTRLGPAALSVPLPVDLGRHELVVGAPGKRTTKLVLTLTTEGTTATAELPPLRDLPDPTRARGRPSTLSAATSRSGPPGAESVQHDRSRLSSLVAGATVGAGVVSAILGTYFGLDALDAWSERNRHCVDGRCDELAVRAAERAKRSARLCDVLLAVGVVSVGAGAYVWLQASVDVRKPEPGSESAPGSAFTALGATGVF